jgi:hypothetical protein
MRPARRYTSREQIDKLHQAIAGLETQQRELCLDFTQHIAEFLRTSTPSGMSRAASMLLTLSLSRKMSV